MSIEFLTNYPALYISDIKSIVISDLHIGLEHELYSKGIIIPPQADKFQKILEKLGKQTMAESLIIIGDLKYEVPGISHREMKEIPKFLEKLKEKFKIIIAKGNHDTGLEEIVPIGIKIYSARGFKVKNYGFFHGHAWPSKKLIQSDYLFMGHIQPAIEVKDKFGHRSVHPVWLIAKLNKEKIKKKYQAKKVGKLVLIILPSFNHLSGYYILNKNEKQKLIGPFFSNEMVNLEESKVYFLDGTYLGKLKNLKNKN
ncbi:MAG: metallophosphoesterase [Candidatus Aenigmatarchaeota archaeon]